jgi:hypothetical protein
MKFAEMVEPHDKGARSLYRLKGIVDVAFRPDAKDGSFIAPGDDAKRPYLVGNFVVVNRVRLGDAERMQEGDPEVMADYLWVRGKNTIVPKVRQERVDFPLALATELDDLASVVPYARELAPVSPDLSEISRDTPVEARV